MESKRDLPPEIVKFTISKEALKDILSEKYNTDIHKFSVEDEGISITLLTPEKGEKEAKEEEQHFNSQTEKEVESSESRFP